MTVLYFTVLSLYFDWIFNATENIAQTWALNKAPKKKVISQAESVG